jgi:FkbM family methyltransferase
VRRLAGQPAYPPNGRIVSPWALFVLREVSRRRGTHVYRLRESGLRLAIRHHTGDPATLTEVFFLRYYDPPEEVARVIEQPDVILDLGANVGMFGMFAADRWPTAQIVSYEPDPTNLVVHERTVAANALGHRFNLVPAAAGARNREVRFAAGLEALSHVVDGDAEAPAASMTVPMRDVLPEVCSAGLVKLDIEGGEWEILLDPRLRTDPPPAIVLEYHPRGCPARDPLALAEQALHDAGLRTAVIWARNDGHGMLWGWRQSRN